MGITPPSRAAAAPRSADATWRACMGSKGSTVRVRGTLAAPVRPADSMGPMRERHPVMSRRQIHAARHAQAGARGGRTLFLPLHTVTPSHPPVCCGHARGGGEPYGQL